MHVYLENATDFCLAPHYILHLYFVAQSKTQSLNVGKTIHVGLTWFKQYLLVINIQVYNYYNTFDNKIENLIFESSPWTYLNMLKVILFFFLEKSLLTNQRSKTEVTRVFEIQSPET